MSEYVMYIFPNCPYCQRVVGYLAMNVDDWDRRVELRDAYEPEVAAELVALGGKRQVPCLNISGVPLYESDDIIAYFEEEKALNGGSATGTAACPVT
ncbi:MAG: glutathione S-transferase N-terminal domain-containing protein [Actinomycetes bacterium]|jgi:glutaredoxin|nr:glutathione S-transferase N-terminal domain-containing protein [Actinomycetes bacterium]